MSDPQRGTITRDDIESRLRGLQGDFDNVARSARTPALAAAAAAFVALVGGAYLLGRRRGRKRSAVVEIRRL